MTQSWAPAPQAQPLIKKPRRWLWIAGLLAALSAGVAVGAVIGLGQVPADDNPKVLAALNEVADVRAAADQQAAQREEEVRVQADALTRAKARSTSESRRSTSARMLWTSARRRWTSATRD